MTFNFLRKSVAGIYVRQLTVIKRLNLIVDKNCETVSVSCDMSTLTEVATLTAVEVLFGPPTQLYISYKTKNTHQMLSYIRLFYCISETLFNIVFLFFFTNITTM